ncbi:hypothetical protein B0H63DRAFT_523071 [Podospora didyma]|uniref:BTB domain-containing protein n=1 Tax=Podospora didyma TaxID=330526 RepID=A0AAE0NQL4_9PEZI|nr:hypothetical protein B0H63DRAFT_523071 [Podospora didyma]
MGSLLQSGARYSDMVFVCKGGDKISVHRAIVCPQCPVVAAAMDGKWNEEQESKTGEYDFTDHHIGIARHFVHFLYAGKYDDIRDEDNDLEQLGIDALWSSVAGDSKDRSASPDSDSPSIGSGAGSGWDGPPVFRKVRRYQPRTPREKKVNKFKDAIKSIPNPPEGTTELEPSGAVALATIRRLLLHLNMYILGDRLGHPEQYLQFWLALLENAYHLTPSDSRPNMMRHTVCHFMTVLSVHIGAPAETELLHFMLDVQDDEGAGAG